MMLHVNDHMSRGLWVRILLVYIFSGLDGPDFSPKSELMLFRTDSVRTARTPYGLHGLRTDCSDSTRTPHGLRMDWHGLPLVRVDSARTPCSPCGVHKDPWGTVNYCMESMWTPCGVHVESMSTLHGVHRHFQKYSGLHGQCSNSVSWTLWTIFCGLLVDFRRLLMDFRRLLMDFRRLLMDSP